MEDAQFIKRLHTPFKFKVLHYLRIIIAKIARFIFILCLGKDGEKIPPISDDILKLPAIEVAKKIRQKEVTSVEVLEACIRRIQDVNPVLNCLVENRFELAMKEAKEADQLIRDGLKSAEQLENEKPFLGVPFTTKDHISVKGLHVTVGVMRQKDVVADEDAEAIKLLRDKGAIIIGCTIVPENCMWWDTHNLIHGKCHNPYNTTRTVGGSSGGEGCIQTVGGSVFGIGSDIGGSIRIPSVFNGIFGHKTSKNIISNKGLVPYPGTELLNSYLSVGPMTKHAVDLKPLLKILSGTNSSKLNLDHPVDISELKIYYQFDLNTPVVDSVDEEIKTALRNVVEHLKSKYKVKTEETNMCFTKAVLIWIVSIKNKLAYAEQIMGTDKSIFGLFIEILKKCIGRSENTLAGIFTAIFDKGGVKINSPEYEYILQQRQDLENYFKKMLGDNGVFLFPTQPTGAPYVHEIIFKVFNAGYTAIFNPLGFPVTSVPLGLNKEGLPIGIQVVANHNNDRICLAMAEELGNAFGGWIEPQKP